MKILIAEDEAVSRTLLESCLRTWGYEVEVTRDGAEALRCLEASVMPRIAILDWMMPVMEGAEVCERVRACPELSKRVYLIMLTARWRQDDIVRGLQRGADDFVTKPFNRDELRARIGVGLRFIDLHAELETSERRVRKLEDEIVLAGARSLP